MNEEQVLKKRLLEIENQKEIDNKQRQIEKLKKEIGKCYGTHTFRRSFTSEHSEAAMVIGPDKEGKQRYKVVSFNYSIYGKSIQISDTTYGDRSVWRKEISQEQFNKILNYAETHIQKCFVKGVNEMPITQLCDGNESDDISKGKYITDSVPHLDLKGSERLLKALLSVQFPFVIGNKLLLEPYSISLLDEFIIKEKPNIYTPEYWVERWKRLKEVRELIRNMKL